jgi:hypothetical protein
MILIDLNQVIFSGLMAHISTQKNVVIEEPLVRHIVLNTLRIHIKKFRDEYGEVVLCCDNATYWRKTYFPFYKAGRKKIREASSLDWNLIFPILTNIKNELKNNFPYRYIDVENAEADDVIGTLTPRFANNEKILILSSDGDFIQLHQYKNVKQYNPTLKKFITTDNAILSLKEKIIKGDRGDGIPNILSRGNCFVLEERQTPITKKKFDQFINMEFNSSATDELSLAYTRNKTLIDLSCIPVAIKENIIHTYDNTKTAPRSKLLNYFIEKRLKNLMDVIEDY